jgi:Fe-S oxidoreductase
VPRQSISARASTACSVAIPPGRPGPSLAETFVALSRRAGKPLWIPPDVAGLCCSTPWKSKAYHQGHKYMAQAVADALWRWSDGGALPIVVDAASCTLGLSEDVATQLEGERKEQYESLKIIDSIAWCRDLLPNLDHLQEAAAGRRASDVLDDASRAGWRTQADCGLPG